jgi:hypothetical protein
MLQNKQTHTFIQQGYLNTLAAELINKLWGIGDLLFN